MVSIGGAQHRRAKNLHAEGKKGRFPEQLRLKPDDGTTNVRHIASAHLEALAWHEELLGRIAHPLQSEFDHGAKPTLRSLAPDRQLAILEYPDPQSTGVRKITKEIETTDLFASLTSEPDPRSS